MKIAASTQIYVRKWGRCDPIFKGLALGTFTWNAKGLPGGVMV